MLRSYDTNLSFCLNVTQSWFYFSTVKSLENQTIALSYVVLDQIYNNLATRYE